MKKTPKKDVTHKISLKKLEESPHTMGYLDASSSMPSYDALQFDDAKLINSPLFSRKLKRTDFLCNESNDKAGKGYCVPGDELKLTDAKPVSDDKLDGTKDFRELRLSEFSGKENCDMLCNMTEPSALAKKNGGRHGGYACKMSSRTLHPRSNAKCKAAKTCKDIKKCLTERKDALKVTELKKPFDSRCVDTRDNGSYQDSKEESTESLALSCTESLSDCWSGSITDPNFLTEKIRCYSDSGFQEFVSGGSFPVSNANTSTTNIKHEDDSHFKPNIGHGQCNAVIEDKCNEKEVAGNIRSWLYLSDRVHVGADKQMNSRNGISSQDPKPELSKAMGKGTDVDVAKDTEAIDATSAQDDNFCVDDSRDKIFTCQRLNVSGIAELSDLSISDYKQIVSTATSSTIVFTTFTGSLPMHSIDSTTSSINTMTTDTSQNHDEAFKVPSVPAPKIQQLDHPKLVASSSRSYQPINGLDKIPKINGTQDSVSISDCLMKQRHDAENAKAKFLSTTKKRKLIRIKNERYRVVSILGKGGSGKVSSLITLS